MIVREKIYVHGCCGKVHHLRVRDDHSIVCDEHDIKRDVEALELFPDADVSLCSRAYVYYKVYRDIRDEFLMPEQHLRIARLGNHLHVYDYNRTRPVILPAAGVMDNWFGNYTVANETP